VEFDIIDLRDFTTDTRRTVDDYPYGGGCGMVIKPEPVKRALDFAAGKVLSSGGSAPFSIYLTPQGSLLKQKSVEQLSLKEHILLFCGHYEDIDYRARKLFDLELSIGDYVLSGGEPAAAVIADALIRKIPGSLSNPESSEEDSFSGGETLFDCPHYTRPPEWENKKVPEVLLNGDHKKITAYRRARAIINTMKTRPDLLKTEELSDSDFKILKQYFLNYNESED